MKKNTTETISAKSKRIAELRALTDRDIKRAIAQDPDADTPRDKAVWKRGKIMDSRGNVVVPVTMPVDVARFFEDHQLSYVGVLKAFVNAQEGRYD